MNPGIAIIGMHRSGTSCLTGLLEECGVFLADVSRQNPHNKKGNHERLAIMELHDQVLADNGGAWDRPPVMPVQWSESRRARLREIIDDYSGHARWGFKDPRSLLALEGWLEEAPGLRFVGTLRNPDAVALSLHRRGGMPREDALALWAAYSGRLLEFQRRFGFPVVDFDLEPGAYLRSVRLAFSRLDLQVPDDFSFFEAGLRTAGDAAPLLPLPEPARTLYTELRRIAGTS